MAAASKSLKKSVQPATKRKNVKLSDKALPAKKAGTVKGGLIRSGTDDPVP